MSDARRRLLPLICLVVFVCLTVSCTTKTSSTTMPSTTAVAQSSTSAAITTTTEPATATTTDAAGPAKEGAFGGPVATDLYGFDVRQPFIDHDATKALGNPAYKIVTTWVAIGNRQDTMLPFTLTDLELWDAYDHRVPLDHPEAYTETVTPIWIPALKEGDIPPHTVVGGYVSWKVPWYVWPQGVSYRFKASVSGTNGLGQGWMTPIFEDVNAGSPYYLPVGKLLYRGVVSTSKDGTFKPYAPITVAEFATMLLLAAAPYNQATFSDPVASAKRTELATWGSKTASQTLTRLEVALAVAQLAKGKLTAPPPGYQLPFTDVPVSAEDDLALLASNGVIGGTTATSFDPSASCSRGQACQMLALVLDPRFREEESRVITQEFGTTSTLPSTTTTTSH